MCSLALARPARLNYCSSTTVKFLVCGLLLSIACYYEDKNKYYIYIFLYIVFI